MSWNEGNALDNDIKQEIRSAVRIHQAFWTTLWGSLFALFIYWAVVTALEENSYFFLICTNVYLICAVFCFYCDSKRLSRLDSDYFRWTEETISSIDYIGGRRSHSKVFTNSGGYVTQQLIFGFKVNMNVIVVMYNINGNARTLKENLTFLYDPIAYKVSVS